MTDKKITNEDIIWLTGLLEGEGSFMKPCPSMPNKPIISVQMTDEDIIARVAQMFGRKYQTILPKKDKWKISFGVRVTGGKAVSWMKRLEPHMGKRRKQQIKEALNCFDEKRYEESCKKRRKITNEMILASVDQMKNGSSLRAQARKIGVCHESLRQAIIKRSRKYSDPVQLNLCIT